MATVNCGYKFCCFGDLTVMQISQILQTWIVIVMAEYGDVRVRGTQM